MQLKGKTALITGAKGGLGSYVTNAFLDAGANVAGVSRSINGSDFPHDNFKAFPSEIGGHDAAVQVVQAVVSSFGQVDVLVHLVGGFQGGSGVSETDTSAFEAMMAMNYWSALYMFRAVLPVMRDRRSGCLLAIGSRAALEPGTGIGGYAASKAALVSLVRTVAGEGKEFGVSANIVLPGTMDTPANRKAMPDADFSRWVDPAHVAALLVHLASPAGLSVSGAAIPIYGRDV